MVTPSQGGVKGVAKIIEPTREERGIARRAAEVRATIPDLELADEVDMSAYLSPGRSDDPPITALLVRACAIGLREHPRANAAYRDGHFELYSRINVGVVIDTESERVTATVFDADTKSLAELAAEIEDLEIRADGLSAAERSGATFTVSNLGSYGVARPTAVISPPHAAALAAGEVRAAAVVRDGAVVPGRTMALVLACDHRILYGARAARFLARVRALLERAEV